MLFNVDLCRPNKILNLFHDTFDAIYSFSDNYIRRNDSKLSNSYNLDKTLFLTRPGLSSPVSEYYFNSCSSVFRNRPMVSCIRSSVRSLIDAVVSAFWRFSGRSYALVVYSSKSCCPRNSLNSYFFIELLLGSYCV